MSAWLAVATLLAIVPGMALASPDDRATVAALDTEYQAAMRNNDTATMDRILADDFILVTGSGRVSTKADLLKEARVKDVIYEHQEDSKQTVRVWGNRHRCHFQRCPEWRFGTPPITA